jgi:hypothetical protein
VQKEGRVRARRNGAPNVGHDFRGASLASFNVPSTGSNRPNPVPLIAKLRVRARPNGKEKSEVG